MAELTDTGLVIDTQDEILADIEADQRGNISDRLALSTDTPHGQHNRLQARALRLLQEGLQALYSAMDPDSATGDALDRLGALTGTVRKGATATRTSVVVNVDDATAYDPGDLVAHVDGRPDARFANIEAVANSSGAADDVTVVFEAQDTGPIQCPSDTLVIAGPVSGWNSIVSNTEGSLGSETESDEAYRIRRREEVESPGSASVDGIAADLSRNIEGIQTVTVIENTSDSTDADGIPSHAIEVIVFGPETPTAEDDQDVAEQLFASKAASTPTHGTTTKTVTDSEGYDHTIKFTRPSEVALSVAITVAVDGEYAGDSELAETIAREADKTFRPGLDAAGSMISAWAHGVDGVLRVTSVAIDGGAAWGVHVIDRREVAKIASGSVTVTSTEEAP